MWKLTIEDDEQKQISLPLVHENYGVGRDEANEIRLTERNISRKHATLKRNAQGWIVRDLESYNGTYINGLRVAGEQHVSHGDILQLGDYRLEFVDEARLAPTVPEQAATAASAAPQPLPPHHRPDRLVVVVGPQPGQEFYLDREHFTMGRSEEAEISVNHSSVSRIHAELFAVGNGRYEIIDKGSANGIRINGQEVRRGFIEAGDALELGDVRLRFVGAGKIFRAGFDRSQALPAITGFDAAIKSQKSTGSSSMLKMIAIGAILGVICVGATAAWLAFKPKDSGQPGTSSEPSTPPDAGLKFLEDAKALHSEKKLEEAHKKIGEIPDGSAALKDPAVAEIEGAWADDLFKQVQELKDSAPTDDEEKLNESKQKRVELLWKIRNAKRVDEKRRRAAQAALKELDVEVSDDIDETPANAPPPVIRTGAVPPRPSASASTKVGPGTVDRDALNDPTKKSSALKSRPIGSLSEAELKQLIGACQMEKDNACAGRAAAQLKALQSGAATSSTAKKP